MDKTIKVLYGPELESAISFAYYLSLIDPTYGDSEADPQLLEDLYFYIGKNVVKSITTAEE